MAPSLWGSLFGQGLRNRPSGPRWVERCCPLGVIPKETSPLRPDVSAGYLPAVSRSALVALVIANAFVAAGVPGRRTRVSHGRRRLVMVLLRLAVERPSA